MENLVQILNRFSNIFDEAEGDMQGKQSNSNMICNENNGKSKRKDNSEKWQ